MELWLLDDTLHIKIFFEDTDQDLQDNVCVSIFESCPDEERILLHDETNIYLTPEDACRLAEQVAKRSAFTYTFSASPLHLRG